MATVYFPQPMAAANITIDGNDKGAVSAKFYAALYRPLQPFNQMKLTIYLRILLQPAAPKPFLNNLDYNKNGFFAAPWKASDWKNFIDGLSRQVQDWNNVFWLIPPGSFSEYDQADPSNPKRAWRPNVRCELEVDWNAKDHADRTVSVVNLDPVLNAFLPYSFRDDSGQYNSSSLNAYNPVMDSKGHTITKNAVVHEVGHMLGLDHIGVIMDTQMCKFASPDYAFRVGGSGING